MLQRRHLFIEFIKCIGKESNNLEKAEEGLAHSEQDVYTEYPDPSRDEWAMVTLPALKDMPLPLLMEKSGMSRSALQKMRAGETRPHPDNVKLLTAIARAWIKRQEEPFSESDDCAAVR